MVDKRDRLTLSRDIEVIADRIALSGQTGRADELKVVAAHLRAKDAARTHDAVAGAGAAALRPGCRRPRGVARRRAARGSSCSAEPRQGTASAGVASTEPRP